MGWAGQAERNGKRLEAKQGRQSKEGKARILQGKGILQITSLL